MGNGASRRRFLHGIGAAAVLWPASLRSLGGWSPFPPEGDLPPIYPPMDLSYFDEPITAAPSEIRIGYAAITWGGTDRDATDDIADLGYTGIQLRSTIVPEWCDKPRALADELAKRKLTFVALSSGGADIQNDRAAEIAAHVKNARF